MKKILVDGRPLVRRLSGIGRFTVDAINALAEKASITIAVNQEIPQATKAQLSPDVNIIMSPAPVISTNRLFWLYFHLPKVCKHIGPDWYWNPVGDVIPFGVNTNIKILTTFHDFVSFDFPETMLWKDKLVKRATLRRVFYRTDLAWCVSKFTEERLLALYPRLKWHTVVGSSIRPAFFSPATPASLERVNIRERFAIPNGKKIILFVGNLEPRKNLGLLLELMPKLSEIGYILVAVGCKAWESNRMVQLIADSIKKEYSVFLGYVDDNDLCNLYKIAEVFVSPSFYEGFGLPQLEAMASGCPVVSSNNSAIREIVSSAGILVSGYDPTDWEKAIIQTSTCREEWSRRALEKSGSFSWSKVANNVIREIHAHST